MYTEHWKTPCNVNVFFCVYGSGEKVSSSHSIFYLYLGMTLVILMKSLFFNPFFLRAQLKFDYFYIQKLCIHIVDAQTNGCIINVYLRMKERKICKQVDLNGWRGIRILAFISSQLMDLVIYIYLY